MKGSTYRRCYCRDENGKPYGKACPQLSSRRHGTYAVRQELPPRADGTRRSFSRSGYETATKAQGALDEVRALLAIPDGDDVEGQTRIGDLLEAVSKDKKAPVPPLAETRRRFHTGASLADKPLLGPLLEAWIAGKDGRKTAITRDEGNIRLYLVPYLGHIRADRLRVSHITEMFAAIAEANAALVESNAQRRKAVEELKALRGRAARRAAKEAIAAMPPFRRPAGPASMLRILSTLRAAINDLIAQQEYGLTFNPAAHVELRGGKRPKGLLWTAERVARWEETGEKPSTVMVWTPAQLARFLVHAKQDRLYPLYHLVAFRGLRRGEACGQEWTDTDLDAGTLTVSRELVVDGWEVYEDDPKTDSGARTIALDTATVKVLREHRARQAAEREKVGAGWVNTGKVFTQEDGSWLHPVKVTDRFVALYEEAGLPPVRLHDLRHLAATLIHAGGGDLHTIKETLGHSGIAITSDTYTSLLPQVDREVAERAAALVRLDEETEINGTAAHAPLTQTAPDGAPEAGPESPPEGSAAGQAEDAA